MQSASTSSAPDVVDSHPVAADRTAPAYPPDVADLLEPISSNKPEGEDLGSSGDTAYHKLRMAMTAATVDADACIDLATRILKEKSKDLQVGVYLSFAWYKTERFAGLRNGFYLLAGLLANYGDRLSPSDPDRRAKSLHFLVNQKPLAKLLAKEPVTAANAKDATELAEAFHLLEAEYRKLFPRDPPLLKDVARVVGEIDKAAHDLPHSAAPAGRTEPAPVREPAVSGKRTAAAVPVSPKESVPAATAPIGDVPAALKRVLLGAFEEEGTGKRKVADEPFIYGMSRQLQWGRVLASPPEKGGITEIEGPAKPKQEFIKRLCGEKNWEELIPEIEIQFLNHPGFRYWLDAQRLVVLGMVERGPAGRNAAAEIQTQLARFIHRFPGIPQMKFKDKVTGFADGETIAWLEKEIKGLAGSQRPAEVILPPIMGEEYEQIRKDYESACVELPENVATRLEEMQKGIRMDERRKGKFLRKLNMANYCVAAGRLGMARAFLHELTNTIEELGLHEWEPSLSAAVWESAYILNARVLAAPDAALKHPELSQEQTRLFERICRFDCKRAIVLADNHH